MTESSPNRCPWCGDDPLYVAYHDEEWGVPVYDDRLLFAKLILDGAQAGLSWITILRKRGNYWQAFDQFDPEKIARYDDAKIEALLQNPGIVRNRLKVQSAVKNARGFLEIVEQEGSFSDFLWDFVAGQPVQNRWREMSEVPTKTAVSRAMSKALKQRGFNFVGPTIVYAFMQAVGMVNDHLVGCFRYEQVRTLSGNGPGKNLSGRARRHLSGGNTAAKFGTFDELLAETPAELAAIARGLKAQILALHPDAVEVVRLGDRAASYGVGPKKMSEAYAYIMPQRAWVNLGFYHGANLPDPDGLLEGTGKKLRHVKVRTAQMAAAPALPDLLAAALAERREALDQ